MPLFDLKASPFYLLKVSVRDSGAAIADAAEAAVADGRVDEAIAIRAQQVLMSPRLRLAAELAWVPGLAPNRARELIEDAELGQSFALDLPLLAGANIAAHRCASQTIPALDGLILRFYEQRDDGELLSLLNSERKASGFPEVTADLLADAMPHLMQQHVHALAHLVTNGPRPGPALIGILKQHFDGGSHVVGFLDEVVERFDAWAVPLIAEAESSIARCLNNVRLDPSSFRNFMPAFSLAVETWSSLAAPRQYILGRRHLKDQRTDDLLARIRTVCLHLNNDLDDPKAPLFLTKAAVPAFSESPEHLERVKSDIEILEDRVSTADAFKVLGPLNKLVAELKLSHSPICSSLERGDFKESGKGIAGNLFRLFKSAAVDLAGTPAAMAPFRLVLSLAIDLHNDSNASDEALILISSMQRFDAARADADTATKIKENGTIIYCVALQKKLATAAKAKQHKRCAHIARDLEDAATDGDERAGWRKLRLEFERRRRVQYWTFGSIAAGVIALIAYSSLTDHPPQPSRSYQTRAQPEAPSPAVANNSVKASALYKSGINHIKGNQYDLAIADFNQAIDLVPLYADAFVARGYARAMGHQYDQAILDYDQAAKLDPTLSYAFSLRGRVYADQARYDLALPDFNRAIILNPGDANAYAGRGNIEAMQGQVDQAIFDFDQAIKLAPTSAYMFVLRGRTYAGQGKFDSAIKDFDQAIVLSPEYSYALALRGSSYSKMGEFDLAIRDFDSAISLDPKSFSAFVGRSLAFLAKGDLQQALSDCEQVIRLDPTRKEFVENRGMVYLRSKQTNLAVADFDEALRFNSRLPWSLYGRGVIKIHRGDVAGGRADIRMAQTIQPDVAAELKRYGIQP